MLLFRSNSDEKPFVRASGNSPIQMKAFVWPPISLVAAITIFILASLAWYPSFTSLKEETLAIEQHQKKVLRQSEMLQNLLDKSNQPTWLESYSWLTWQAETERPDFFSKEGFNNNEKGAAPLLFYISLQGVSSYREWMLVLNKLFDQYSLRPNYEQIYWLESGLLDMNLQLQFVPKKFAVKKYQPLPNRLYQTWPKDIEVLAALKWQDKHLLKMRIEEIDMTLKVGDWIPALAANLVSLNDTQATFRQQYVNAFSADYTQSDLVLSYLNRADFTDVSLKLDLNLERSAQSHTDAASQIAFRYERQEDDI